MTDPATTIREPTGPGSLPSLPDGRCNGCELGWERYENPHGIWLHRNANDTLGMACTLGEPVTDPATTIREALGLLRGIDYEEGSRIDRAVEMLDSALAALTELEQQLAAERAEVQRMVTALDGMARAPYGEYQAMHERAEAAERERDQLKKELFDWKMARGGIKTEEQLAETEIQLEAAERERDQLADTLRETGLRLDAVLIGWRDNGLPRDVTRALDAARAALDRQEQT